ncbi:MAG: XRE family transcriptional regulator [Nitrospirae bacterium]|nr:MAG: XRE family transcriptional regulator [Nitrospirota bacterium]
MAETTVDVRALYDAVDGKRQSKELSWRELAGELQIAPSTFTRMAQGRRPDVDTFATLLRWLGETADKFTHSERKKIRDAEPMAMISSYLRSAKNVSPGEAAALEQIIQAAYRHLKGKK